MGCHFLLKGIFLTQGLNPDILHWQVNSLTLSHREAQNSGALAQIKTVTQIWSLYNIHSTKKKPVLIKNVLDEAVKITDFIKNLLLNIYLLNTLCGKMANIYKALLLNTEYEDCVEKRYLCKALNHELTAVFHGTSFVLERLIDRQTLITQSWVFTGIFLEMSHPRHFKEKDWVGFGSMTGQ